MINFKDNKNKSPLNTRWAQMTKQEQIIERKKMEIQAKLEAQKQAAALAARAKLSNPTPKDDEGKTNIFSNDGSFMSQFKALLEKQKQEKEEKEEKEKERRRVEEEKLNNQKEREDHSDNEEPCEEKRRYESRGNREKHRRWNDRGRNRPHSPMTPIAEDKNKPDKNNIPALMQIPIRPPDEPQESEPDHDNWPQEPNDSNKDSDTNQDNNTFMSPGPGPMPLGPMPPGLMGPGMAPPGPHNVGSGPLMGPGGQNMPPMPPRPMPPFMGGPPNFSMPPNFLGPNGPGPMPPNMMSRPNGPMPPFFGPPFPPGMMGPNGPPNGPPNSGMGPNGPTMRPNGPPNSMMGPNGPPNSMMGPNGPPNSTIGGPNGPPPNMMPPPGPPNSMMGPNGPGNMMPPNSIMGPNGPPNPMMGPNAPPAPLLGPSGPLLGAPHNPLCMSGPPPMGPSGPPSGRMPFLPRPPFVRFPPPEGGAAPPPLGGPPDDDDSQVLGAGGGGAAAGGGGRRARPRLAQWSSPHPNSNEYQEFRELVSKFREEQKPQIKDEDKYEPEFSLEDDDSNDAKPQVKEENSNSNTSWPKRENASSQSDDEGESKRERRKRKKKSRWGDEPPVVDIKPPGVVAPLPGIGVTGAKLAKIDEDGLKLTNINRNNQALMQYAMTNYGTTNLSPEDWKKCEDNFKLNLLYQDMLKKRQEVERLAAAGKHKYEYDSDEDTSEGTWEHRLRAREMSATERWADELTKQAAGKHHIGDFLPPEELKKFMEKYDAMKSGKEPDLSDYKEFKLKEDNVGFKMLQKLGWNEGQGLGAEGSGIVEPINKGAQGGSTLGLGAARGAVCAEDDEFDAYRKRMMLAYRFRPNPLNNPRRPYY